MKSILFLALALISLSAAASDAGFRADANHDGAYADTTHVQGHMKWKFHTDGPVVSTPAVADGVLYVGSNDHFVYALDAASGTQKWRFETKGRVPSSPAVVGGHVFVASYDGFLYALDAATGALKWKFATAGERRFTAPHLHGADPASETMPDVFDVYLSSPNVADGTVYFGSGDGKVYAIDAGSGKLRWKFATGNVVHASPAVAGGQVYIGSWDSNFYALDAKTGKLAWRFHAGVDPAIHNQEGFQSSAAVVNDVVYVGCRDSKFYALDAKTGKQKWMIDNKGSWVVGSPAVRAGKVYFTTSDSALFYEVNAQTGQVSFSIDMHGWPMFSSPTIAGDKVYVGSNSGQLLAIDLAQKRLAWHFDTDGAKANAAAYTKPDGTPNYDLAFNGSFYDDFVVGAYRMYSVGAVLSSPVVAGGRVYFGGYDGNVYAVE